MFGDLAAIVLYSANWEIAHHAVQDQERAAYDMALYRTLGEESHRRLFGATSKPVRKTYGCAGCGAPLFGIVNENCQYCKRPVGNN